MPGAKGKGCDVLAFYTPLRYPGGKGRLFRLFTILLSKNSLCDAHYVEPYAGGAGLAIALMLLEYVRTIFLNDLDRAVYAFWYSILNHTADFCRKIEVTPVTIDEWHKQQEIQQKSRTINLFDLGFSTFFLNRTNRSGILRGGVIGGKEQQGEWKLDARFNKKNLISRIKGIALNKSRIVISNRDAFEFLKDLTPSLPSKSIIYADPPYYKKGQALYANYYGHEDHLILSELMRSFEGKNWVVSYDNISQIRELYCGYQNIVYDLSYSASSRYKGSEIMFFSNSIVIPDLEELASCGGLHNIEIAKFVC